MLLKHSFGLERAATTRMGSAGGGLGLLLGGGCRRCPDCGGRCRGIESEFGTQFAEAAVGLDVSIPHRNERACEPATLLRP